MNMTSEPLNTKPVSVSALAVEKILKSLDPDLAAIAVCSAISMKLEDMLKILVTVSDVSYLRNMQRELTMAPALGELSAKEIKRLLKTDGWLI
jgi:hypothetical protein